jgi:hypothetical protein
MALTPDWAKSHVTENGSGGAHIALHVDGLRAADVHVRARYFDLGLEPPPLGSDGQALWDELSVNFDTNTITIGVPSTEHGSEIRDAIDSQLAKLAEELDRIEAARTEQDQIASEEARQRQEQLDRLRADLGS